MFPDKNLEAALRTLVFEKKSNMEELTDDDLRKMSTFEAKGKKIQNLAGLEKCTNLLLIDLANNEISDLAPLRGLANLQSLNLAQNKIADITPLMDLNKLQYLELSNNEIRALQPLSAMTKLSALYLAENKIVELAPLAGLAGLSSLDLAKNQMVDIKPLGGIARFSVLKLSDNAIEDIAPGHAASAAEHAVDRAQQDGRPDAAGRGSQGRRRGQEKLRPVPAAVPGRQSALGQSQERAACRAQGSRRADRELSGSVVRGADGI